MKVRIDYSFKRVIDEGKNPEMRSECNDERGDGKCQALEDDNKDNIFLCRSYQSQDPKLERIRFQCD